MKFLSPGWLWLELLLPVLFWLIVRDERRRRAQFELFAERAVWRVLVPELDPEARLRKAAAWLAVLGLVVLSLARPQWGSHEETIQATGLDIMVAIDVSNSMETEDVIPSRLKKARHLVKTLLDQVKGDRVGLVAFAASAYVACPLTTDTDYVLETLSILGPRMIASQGTDIGIGIDTARKALDRGAEEAQTPVGQSPGGAASAPPSHVIVLISDGEDQEEGTLSAARQVVESGAKLYILGVGTQKGGPVPVRDEAGSLVTYKKTRRGEPVISTFRPDALMKVAQAAGGRYWNVTDGEGEVQEMLSDMGALNRTEYAERRYLVYEDRFQFPLALAVLLAFVEISLPVRRIRKGRSSAAAPAPGAKAAPIGVLLLASLATLALGGGEARADLLDHQTPLEAYLDNEKGLKSFKDGKIDEAEKRFGTAQALDPTLPELHYNQGLIQMQKGDTDAAIRGFDEAAKGAFERRDPKLESKSLFNLGGAQAKKGDTQGAVRSYLGAITSAQRSKDAQLEEDARRNLQLLIRERQKQKQQEQDKQDKKKGDQQNQDQQGGDQDQDKKDQKGKKDQQDSKDQKDSKDDKDKDGQSGKQAKQFEDPSQSRKRQFKSAKLSKEDAERVMAELSNREKDLQAKVKKQNGTPQQQINEKDW